MPPKNRRRPEEGDERRQAPAAQFRCYCFTLVEGALPMLLSRCPIADIQRTPTGAIETFVWKAEAEETSAALTKFFGYWICQLEKCPRTGAPHFQGYFELLAAETIVSLKTKLEPVFGEASNYVHYEVARGTREENLAYCSKDETRWEGTFPMLFEQATPGAVNGEDVEFQYIMGHVRKHSTIKEILDGIEHEAKIPAKRRAGVMWKVLAQTKALTHVINYYKAVDIPLYRAVEVWVIWGDPGVGKTWDVLHPPPGSDYTTEDVYRRTLSLGQWWDGYNGEKVLVLDDFGCPDSRGNFPIPPGEMLDIMQGYQHRVQVKGSVVQGNWLKVFIISNIEPNRWYRDWIMVDPAVKQAFFDRIPGTQIIHKVGHSLRGTDSNNNNTATAASATASATAELILH